MAKRSLTKKDSKARKAKAKGGRSGGGRVKKQAPGRKRVGKVRTPAWLRRLRRARAEAWADIRGLTERGVRGVGVTAGWPYYFDRARQRFVDHVNAVAAGGLLQGATPGDWPEVMEAELCWLRAELRAAGLPGGDDGE